jgi:transcriptional regulator with GAF, ATPase, and Fis domain
MPFWALRSWFGPVFCSYNGGNQPGEGMPSTTEAWARLASEIQGQGLTPENSRRLARELARSFGVRDDEIGILRLEGSALVFCHPAKLQEVGRIPLNSSSSVAARTASTRRSEMINNFSQVKHTSFFEAVDLSESEVEDGERTDLSARVIQKLISAPVMDGKKVLGVIQVCRKGSSSSGAGPDFTQAELQHLTDTASAVVACFRD